MLKNYEHIEDWFESIVKTNAYASTKKIWRTFEKQVMRIYIK